jgi:hypothetical protein
MPAGAGTERESAAAIARISGAERFASAIVMAFDLCGEAGKALSQLQRIAIIEAALLEFDGFDAQLRSSATIEDLLRALGGNGRKA